MADPYLPKKVDNVSGRLSQWLEPLVASFAFTRLANLTFLGILSPRFSFLPGFPFKETGRQPDSDGSRADHSLGVASLVIEIAKSLKLSEKAQKLGLVWAVLHDVATWPLSHTGEAAFSELTDIKADDLRTAIITGSSFLPVYLSVQKELRLLNVDLDNLLCLYDKRHNNLSGDLSILWQVINSPLTPDTLEGMYRSGQVFRVRTPHLKEITNSFHTDLFTDAFIEGDKSKPVLDFWRAKSRIYRSFINSKAAISFESEWALRIEDCFRGVALAESLLLPENAIISVALNHSLNRRFVQKRYKPPHNYFIAHSYARKRKLEGALQLDDLSEVLGKVRAKTTYD